MLLVQLIGGHMDRVGSKSNEWYPLRWGHTFKPWNIILRIKYKLLNLEYKPIPDVTPSTSLFSFPAIPLIVTLGSSQAEMFLLSTH